MLPEISIGNIHVQSYGIMVLLGAIAAIFYCTHTIRKQGYDADEMLDVLIYAGIGAFIGGKVLYLLVDLSWLSEQLPLLFSDPLAFLRYLSGGFVFYGGLIGVFAAVFFYFYRHLAFALEEYLAFCMPAIPLFHFFGRIGCFLAGCCYGETSSSILAVPVFTQANPEVLVNRLPIQLYEAGFNLLLFVCLLLLVFRRRNGIFQLGFYLTAYGVFRFIAEWFRGDAARGVWLLSTSQWVSLILVPIGIWMLVDSRLFLRFIHRIRDRKTEA
ncbi:prolipoprotein diacylglyceryl transferase [Merdibacter massiliensis]|uniref:prolipoprotein diacylglyceryl transferase n=1 Tax=Merdibacter massiliensis TaxID=1871030 RepID=UPI00096A23A7|nr:prolipoprotein diacylglyceryl transferase family protein [Merdibacter massiliensis]